MSVQQQHQQQAAAANLKSTGQEGPSADDARYACDPTQLQQVRQAVPWMKDPRFFTSVALSPSSVMKIMMHCASGVEKGIAKGGNPIEVMGLLLGRPDPAAPTTLVVTDAFALPIEGFETRVIADDEQVVNHMIALGESLERTRNEKFMGWYHSHPFDVVPDRSHCFLSQTDLSTQLQWQRAEDPHGNPFVAIVVDPLRSALLEQPQLKAFRAYPPEYQSSVTNECPDGTVEHSEQSRLEHWGSCWNRYYELQIEYYMSSSSRRVLEQLTHEYLWIRTLQRPAADVQVQALASAAHQVAVAAQAKSSGGGGGSSSALLSAAASSSWAPPAAAGSSSSRSRGGSAARSTAAAGSGPGGAAVAAAAAAAGDVGGFVQAAEQGLAPGGAGAASAAMVPPPRTNKEFTKAVQQLVQVAANEACEANLQTTKERIFG